MISKAKLSEITSTLESGSRPKGGVDGNNGEIFSIGGEHLNDVGSFTLKNRKYVSQEFFSQMKQGVIQLFDILIVKDGATTGKVAFVDSSFPHFPSCINEHVFRLAVDRKHVDPKYVFFYLLSRQGNHEIMMDFHGATVGGISRAFAEKVFVPLPHLNEQQRIVAIIEAADDERRCRRATQELSDNFLQDVFVQMFGDPVTNTRNWPISKLGLIASVSRGKFTPRPRNNPIYYNGEYPFIQTGDIANADGFLRVWTQTLNDKGTRISKAFEPGTIVVAIVGATIGESAILTFRSYCPDSVIGINVNPSICTPEYIEYLLRFWKPIFRAQAPETARANINLETLKPLATCLPPVELQTEFSSIVYIHEHMRRQQQESARQSEHLFQTLLHQAFNGEL